MAVKLGIAVHIVIGAHNRGVAPDIAAAQIPALQHRDIRQPVVFCQIIRRGQPVPAPADDDHIIFSLGRRVAPNRCPALVAGQPLL